MGRTATDTGKVRSCNAADQADGTGVEAWEPERGFGNTPLISLSKLTKGRKKDRWPFSRAESGFDVCGGGK